MDVKHKYRGLQGYENHFEIHHELCKQHDEEFIKSCTLDIKQGIHLHNVVHVSVFGLQGPG